MYVCEKLPKIYENHVPFKKNSLIKVPLSSSNHMRTHIYICTSGYNPLLCAAAGK